MTHALSPRVETRNTAAVDTRYIFSRPLSPLLQELYVMPNMSPWLRSLTRVLESIDTGQRYVSLFESARFIILAGVEPINSAV